MKPDVYRDGMLPRILRCELYANGASGTSAGNDACRKQIGVGTRCEGGPLRMETAVEWRRDGGEEVALDAP